MEEKNSPPDQVLKSFSRSQSSVIRLEHTWVIDNFSLLPQKTGESLVSTVFCDQSEEKVEWQLELYPKGENEQSKNFISLYLMLHKPQPALKLNATSKCVLINRNQSLLARGAVHTAVFKSGPGWGYAKLLEQIKITPTTLPRDELHVKGEVTYTVKHTSLSGPHPSLPIASSGSGSMATHYKQLFESKLQSDIVIQVKDAKFDAHKLVLGTRSPVFLAMFQSNLTETQTNTLKIKGIEPAVFKEVLRFLYTDQVEQLDELAEELLAAAERYMLDLLKEKCVAHLAAKITVESCADVLLLADLHSAAGLKKIVLDFFRCRAAEVGETASWQQLMDSANPHLLRDISKALIPKRSDGSSH